MLKRKNLFSKRKDKWSWTHLVTFNTIIWFFFSSFYLQTFIIIYHSQTALISFQSGHDIQKSTKKYIFLKETSHTWFSVLLDSINVWLLVSYSSFLLHAVIWLPFCWSQINLLTLSKSRCIYMWDTCLWRFKSWRESCWKSMELPMIIECT